MKRRIDPRPGQVYLDTKTWNVATIYFVGDGVIRAVVAKSARGRINARQRSHWSLLWRKGVPDHYVIQYNPPERNEE